MEDRKTPNEAPPLPKGPDNIIIVDNPISKFETGLIITLGILLLVLIGCVAGGILKRAS
jgi:hypothetical protein